MSRFRPRLSYANVISTICLILLVGGGSAIAASQFGKETIGSNALKKESIGPGKLNKAAKAALEGRRGVDGRAAGSGPRQVDGLRGGLDGVGHGQAQQGTCAPIDWATSTRGGPRIGGRTVHKIARRLHR